jgi:hypothetical protein
MEDIVFFVAVGPSEPIRGNSGLNAPQQGNDAAAEVLPQDELQREVVHRQDPADFG